MVRKNKSKKSGRRQARRRPVMRRRVMAFPPPIPFNRVMMNVVLRHVIEEQQIGNKIFIKDITITDMFASPWDKLKEVFSEVRITKAVIYASAGTGLATAGFHALNLAPKMEFEPTETISFATLTALPGTKMSAIGRMVSAEWHPTSSDERVWIKVDSSRSLFDYVYMTKGMDVGGKSEVKFPLALTFDYHVKLRGVNYLKLKTCLDVNDPVTMSPNSIGECGFHHLDIDG